MLVEEAREIARRWVMEEGRKTPGFYGAFFHGSTNWLPGDAAMPAFSDVDVMLVLDSPEIPSKPGMLRYRGATLEISYLSRGEIESPEQTLGVSHLAGSFRAPGIIADPSGRLTELQSSVSRDYAKRYWVRKRCEHAREKVLANLHGLSESQPFHDQAMGWLFGTGVTTHILLVAGLRNPTVRRRYLAVRTLLDDYGRLDYYDTLLEMLGCALMSKTQVEGHLDALTGAFDAAKGVIKSPFPFAADISDAGRPVAIDGSRELIESGYHREAVFWIAVSYSRCQKVLYHDAPFETRDRFTPGYRQLLRDLGITSFLDIERRAGQIAGLLPGVWDVAEAIMAANPQIED